MCFLSFSENILCDWRFPMCFLSVLPGCHFLTDRPTPQLFIYIRILACFSLSANSKFFMLLGDVNISGCTNPLKSSRNRNREKAPLFLSLDEFGKTQSGESQVWNGNELLSALGEISFMKDWDKFLGSQNILSTCGLS